MDRAEMIEKGGQNILKIRPKNFSTILIEQVSNFFIGLMIGVIIGFILYTILDQIEVLPSPYPLVILAAVALAIGILFVRWVNSGNTQMKPFYVKLSREKYELWEDRSTKRIQGKSSNIYIQISNKKGAKRIKIKRNNEHGSIYEDDFLTEDDIGVIRQYFKENNVERIG